MKTLAFFLLTAALALGAAPEYPAMGPDIYDAKADGGKKVDAALAQAGAEHKRVLLDFGANWCIWCRRLHAVFENDPAVSSKVQAGYVLVYVDVNTRHGDRRNAAIVEKYGHPTKKGIPALVILDSDGRPLVTEDTEDLGDDKAYSPEKVAAFLQRWAPR
jgi:thiol:disulfide interchange protein